MNHFTRKLLVLVLLSLVLPLSACGEDPGTAPVISSLSLSPDEVAVGGATPMIATLQFQDPEGDVLEANVSIRAEGEPAGATSTVPVTGASGIPAGAVSIQIALAPPAPGDYVVTLWLRDAQGNDSNRLESTLTAR